MYPLEEDRDNVELSAAAGDGGAGSSTDGSDSDVVGLKKRVGLIGGLSLIVGSIVGENTGYICIMRCCTRRVSTVGANVPM